MDTFMDESPAPAACGVYFLSTIITLYKAAFDAGLRRWITLCENEPARSLYNGEALARCAETLLTRMIDPQITRLAEFSRPLKMYNLRTTLCQDHRKLFRTNNDLLGWGPDALREIDEIWILGGAKVPFALRRIAGKTGHYQLLGECYVHGIMFGNGMQHFDTTPRDIVLE